MSKAKCLPLGRRRHAGLAGPTPRVEGGTAHRHQAGYGLRSRWEAGGTGQRSPRLREVPGPGPNGLTTMKRHKRPDEWGAPANPKADAVSPGYSPEVFFHHN